ncbi:MAG: hypothetical protein J5605_06950 [Bacteroidales bacterium]|nr:hypothetical protein [Bacteroidales bacterium]
MKHALKTTAMALMLITLTAQAQQKRPQQQPSEKYATAVTGTNYEGYAFNEEFETDITVENQAGRFTLSTEDIAILEKLLQKKIAKLNHSHNHQASMDCQLIDEHLEKYKRQYIGFINYDGDKVVWVNFVRDSRFDKLLIYEIPNIKGGCSNFFSVKVNMDHRIVYDLEVNDPGDVVYTKPAVKRKYRRVSRPK